MKIKFLAMMMAMSFAMLTMSCSSSDDNGPTTVPDYDIIVGKWESPVPAPIFGGLISSIEVEFRNNQTYTVLSRNSDGSTTTLEGTYVTSTGANGIRNIVLEQSSPTSLTSTGIYQITQNDTRMSYEVVQTSPDLGFAAPTPSGGFGSTANGAFGDANIQIYNRIN
ncbi:MAG: hypothetical protein Q4G27_09870 [Flavobacteriaceae bacterium]|nr:hypothetical protein [Flavobacteriaceae bacterium]